MPDDHRPAIRSEGYAARDAGVSTEDLDHHLGQTLKLLEESWFAPDTGVVAACLLDPATGEAIYDVSRDIGRNLYSHAERNVIERYEREHRRPPPHDAILITTLSPCIGETTWRVGESCSDLAAKYGLRRLHVGLVDPQHPPPDSHGFEISVTRDAELARQCRRLRELFNLRAPRRDDGAPGRLAEAYKGRDIFNSVFKPRP